MWHVDNIWISVWHLWAMEIRITYTLVEVITSENIEHGSEE